jgi:hypothetical protein
MVPSLADRLKSDQSEVRCAASEEWLCLAGWVGFLPRVCALASVVLCTEKRAAESLSRVPSRSQQYNACARLSGELCGSMKLVKLASHPLGSAAFCQACRYPPRNDHRDFWSLALSFLHLEDTTQYHIAGDGVRAE